MNFCSYGCGNEAIYTLKNGKNCCQISPNKCPENRKKNSNKRKGQQYNRVRINPNLTRVKCKFCNKDLGTPGLKNHENSCYLNPNNIRYCCFCEKILKNKHSKTCSYKCSSAFFKHHTKDPNIIRNYREICFYYHKKECIICKESNVVEVHHLDLNHKNNDPLNLIPLCPTHHKYLTTKKYKNLVLEKIIDYLKEFKINYINMDKFQEYSKNNIKEIEPEKKKILVKKIKCKYCSSLIIFNSLNKHEKTCYLNPDNIRFCPVCNNIIKNKGTTTCSNKCGRIYFKDINTKYLNNKSEI
jgi:hypothetical protein